MKSRVKVIGLLLVLAFIGGHADAQKCKYRYERIDGFSEKPSKGIAKPVFNLYSELKMDRTGDQYTMEFLIIYANLRDDHVEKGDSVSFKLQNGDMVTFTQITGINPTIICRSEQFIDRHTRCLRIGSNS